MGAYWKLACMRARMASRVPACVRLPLRCRQSHSWASCAAHRLPRCECDSEHAYTRTHMQRPSGGHRCRRRRSRAMRIQAWTQAPISEPPTTLKNPRRDLRPVCLRAYIGINGCVYMCASYTCRDARMKKQPLRHLSAQSMALRIQNTSTSMLAEASRREPPRDASIASKS